MSTSLAIPTEERTVSKSSSALSAMFIASLCLGYGILLVRHGRLLWETQQYQYFPFVLAAFAYLAASRYTEGFCREPEASAHCRIRGLTALAILLLAAGTLLNSAWLAAVSLIVLIAACITAISQTRVMPGIWFVWGLLWLTIQPPLGYDKSVVLRLQLISSWLSSQVLDLLGYRHLMSGNVLTLPDKTFFVDEACSGIVSMMSVIAFAATYGVWMRRILPHLVLLVLLGIGWATALNIVRIVAITIAHSYWSIDLSTGWPHEVLGLALFTVTILATLSTDRLLAFVLEPIGPPADPEERLNPLVSVFNRLFRADVVDAHPTTAHSSPPVSSFLERLPARSIIAGLSVLGVVGLCLLWLDGQNVDLIRFDKQLAAVRETIDGSALPHEIGDWQLIEFNEIERDPNSAFDFLSKAYRFQHRDTNEQAIVSFDYPFFLSWHELSDCYRYSGWHLTRRSLVDAAGVELAGRWEYIEADFDQPGRSAHLLFAIFDSQAIEVNPPGQLVSYELERRFYPKRLIQRLAKLRIYNSEAARRIYQVQVFTEGDSVASSKQRDELRELFLVSRRVFLESFKRIAFAR